MSIGEHIWLIYAGMIIPSPFVNLSWSPSKLTMDSPDLTTPTDNS